MFSNIYRPQANPLAISPGELRSEVQFAKVSATVDSFGQPQNTWDTYLTIHAKVENVSGQQVFQTGDFSSRAIWKLTMRWPGAAVINVGDRAFYTDKFGVQHTFVVQILNNVLERCRKLELTCLEIDGTS